MEWREHLRYIVGVRTGAQMKMLSGVLLAVGVSVGPLLGVTGCASGSGTPVVTETATVTASPSASAPQSREPAPQPLTSGSTAPSDTYQGEKVTYEEIAERVYFVYRGADEIGKAPTLPQTREAWDRFHDASMKLFDLLIMDFTEAGGNDMRMKIADFAEATVVFGSYHSQVIDDRAYCEASGDKAAQQACMRRLSDPNDWGKSFKQLFDAGGRVLDATPG